MLALMRNKPLVNEGSLVLRYFCTRVTFNNSFIGKKTDENLFFSTELFIYTVRSKCNIFSIIRSCVICFSFAYAN